MDEPTALTWANPPAPRTKSKRFNWRGIADELTQHPGDWALVLEQVPKTVAAAARRGRMVALRRTDGTFEVRTRNQKGLIADVYMRWLPHHTKEET